MGDRNADHSSVPGSSGQAQDLTVDAGPIADHMVGRSGLSAWDDYNYGTNLMFRYLEVSLRSNTAALFIAGGIVVYLLANDIDPTAKSSALFIPLSICLLCTIYNGYSVYQADNFAKLRGVREKLHLTVGLDYLLLMRVSLLCAIIHFISFVVIIRLITLL